jgi:hypothetical protein
MTWCFRQFRLRVEIGRMGGRVSPFLSQAMHQDAASEAQIVQILAEGKQGGQIRAPCRRHGISEKTYDRWVAKYGRPAGERGRAPLGARGEESAAEARGDRPGAQPAGDDERSVVAVAQRRDAVNHVMAVAAVSERRACRFTGLSRATQRSGACAASAAHPRAHRASACGGRAPRWPGAAPPRVRPAPRD